MNITKLRGLIQESIQEYLKDIDEAGNRAAVEAKMAKIDEAIKSREDKISRAEALTEDEEMKEMVNTGKISSLKKEIKLFEKAKSKYQKQLDKMDGKKEPKKEIDEFTDLSQDGKGLGIGPIVPPDDFDKPKKENMNESFLKMQKLAGVITEAQYNQKKKALVEAIGDFNAPGFAAAVKENLKKMGYEVNDMKGSSIDSAKGDLEKAANEGKNSAVVGVLEWEDGEEVVAAISLNQKEKDGGMAQQKELKAKIHDLYAKDFTTRFNVGNNGRVLVIGIKDKKENMNESFTRMQKLVGVITEGMDTGIDYEGAGNKYEMFDRMDGLANIQDMRVLNAKLRMLASDWMQDGFDKEDIKEYINFLIDEI
jgi:hypothetical protein